MGLQNRIAQYREYKNGVSHCTFNPEGPGVVRIHLIPPKFRFFRSSAYIVILNGYYLLPLGYSWALILSNFMKEVNQYDGKPITEEDEDSIVERTVRSVHKVYPTVPKKDIEEDLGDLLDILFSVARGNDPDAEIEKLSIRAYRDNMTAPHRMDLMVSAMTDGCGKWKCNQKCVFCYAAGQEMGKTTEMSTEQWKKAIDRLEAARVPMVTFTGGEPTQREDIAELVGYAKRMVTRLNTNGVNLTSELVQDLKKAGLDSVQVTLYSHDESVHNALVGCNHYSARSTADRILSELESADGWNTWDMFGGGGIITYMAKHSHLDEAQDLVSELQSKLRRFKTELADIQITANMQVNIDGFLRFADYFFDGLFADWAVGDKISQSMNSVSSTKSQISRTLDKLNEMEKAADRGIASLKQQLDELIVQA